jgi:hypothetical protein
MAKMIRKGDLPTKTCATCGLPFAWRRKWEKHWNEVKYCSERCGREKRSTGKAGTKAKQKHSADHFRA